MVDIQVVDGPDSEVDEEEEEIFQLLTNGGIRVVARGVVYRLRRPDTGELRKLHTALEAITDELAPIAERQAIVTRDLKTRAQEIDARFREADFDAMSGEEVAAFHDAVASDLAEIGTAQRGLLRDLTAKSEDLRADWWKMVFRALRPKSAAWQVPKSLPGWAFNHELPGKVVEHWMSVPLGRGR